MANSVSSLVTPLEPQHELHPTSKTGASKGQKEGSRLAREAGKSSLPISRVQRILKADKELPTVAKEGVFLISIATEEFIKQLMAAANRVCERERRTTVHHRDIATVAHRVDEFVFLEEIIPWATSALPPRNGKAHS